MSGVEYREPHSLEEACALASEYGEDGKLLAGGTALVLLMRQQLLHPGCLINLQHVPELQGIAADAAGIALGGSTTHAQAARSAQVAGLYPALTQTFRKVATPRVRNQATLGGNLAHGDPHLDPPVSLLALDASVTAASARGSRQIALTAFFRDYYETALEPDEVLVSVRVPARAPRSGLAFLKYLPRSQDDYAAVDLAVWVQLAEDGRIEEARVALGSAGPTPFRAFEAEARLAGQPLTEAVAAEAGELAAKPAEPEDDVRGSAAYKKELIRVLLPRVLAEAAADAGQPAPAPAFAS